MEWEPIKRPGERWRVLAHDEHTTIELEDQGIFDELVVDEWLHIEQMDDNVWWFRVGDARILVTISENGPPIVDIQRGFYGLAKGSTQSEV